MKWTHLIFIATIVISVESLAADPATLEALRRITAPQVVGVPPDNASRGLMVMPNGEVRHYGFRHEGGHKGASQPVYISSRDCGLSWREMSIQGPPANPV